MQRQVNFSWLRRSTLASSLTMIETAPSAGLLSQSGSLKTFGLTALATVLMLAGSTAFPALAQDMAKDLAREMAAPPQTASSEDTQPVTAQEPPRPDSATQPDAMDAAAPAEAEPQRAAESAQDMPVHEQSPQEPQDTTGSIRANAPAAPVADKAEAPAENATDATASASPASPAPTATSVAAKPADPIPALMQAALEKRVYAEAKGPHAAETQKIREELAAFYTMRNFALLWTDKGQITPAAQSLIDRLNHAPDDGLALTALPDLLAGSDDDKINADLALSEAAIAYGRAASGGRIDPKTISPLIGEKPEVAEPFAILSALADAGDKAGNALQNFNPPQKGYQALRGKLEELHRAKPPVAHGPIPPGPELTVGMRDPRVNLIRARFGLDVQQAAASDDLVYDTRVAAAVAGFQKTMGLPASGVLTARTIAALSGGQPSRLEDEILANMERWRWMPRDMGETYIAVNIPDFTVSVIRDDQVLTTHRVVVGKPDTPTPVFSNKMQYLIVNPYWNVPQSIIHKEFLPKGGGDLGYLSAAGWQISSHHGQLSVRQPPGEKNALGRIKFLFPNDYSVYLHDTPSRGLFASAKRAFSHGCVRVDQPFGFAEAVLNHSWSEKRLEGLIGSNERYINLPTPLPIHIEYFTTFVDETGRLQLRDDLYGYSHRVKTALGLGN